MSGVEVKELTYFHNNHRVLADLNDNETIVLLVDCGIDQARGWWEANGKLHPEIRGNDDTSQKGMRIQDRAKEWGSDPGLVELREFSDTTRTGSPRTTAFIIGRK